MANTIFVKKGDSPRRGVGVYVILVTEKRTKAIASALFFFYLQPCSICEIIR